MHVGAKAMARATASNYIHLIIKIVVSLILVRIMFKGLEQEAYGFWALLWSIFGYSVLLDFGLGVTIQKKSAELIASNQMEHISKLFSTYFAVYSLIALIIAASTLLLSFNLEHLFVISDAQHLEEYRLTLLVFGLGSAAAFSLGFMAEILRGMHLLRIRNVINTVFVLANAIGLWQCVVWDQPLYMFALTAVALQFLNNLVFWFVIIKHVPDLKVSRKSMDFSAVRSSLQFSLSAYLVMFSNIIIFRTDQMVISAIAGVSFAGLYQVASRIAELFRQFATQFHESLGTKSAMLNANNDQESLSALLIHSNKIIAAVGTLLFIPAYLLIDSLLLLWLDLTDPDTILSAKILLVSMYILVVFRSSMVQVLLMNDQHVQLMKIGLLEAVSNIVLSIILVRQYGMVGAAIGTLIPNVILALVYNIPVGLRYTSMSLTYYLSSYILPLFIALGAALYAGEWLRQIIIPDTLITLFSNGLIMMFFFALLYIILGFRKEAGQFILSKTSPTFQKK